MDNIYKKRFDLCLEELQYSCHIDIYIRCPPLKSCKYERATFVFNLYHFDDNIWRPYHLLFINCCRQIGYTNSNYHLSDEVRDAQEFFAEKCNNQECYCFKDQHHTPMYDCDKVKRYFEMIVDIGDVFED